MDVLHPAVTTPRTSAAERVAAHAAVVPWFIWCAAAAVTSAIAGTHWDISWHRSIGRDTFWTPAHIAIYLGGVLSGIASAYLILSTTFSSDAARRDASVRIWGLRGPLGAFIAAWGGFTMITSAPFDNWWHNAYGLDVKIISPPHALLMVGMLAIEVGALVLILSFMNRANDETVRSRLESLFLYIGGLMLVGSMIFVFEHTVRVYMHSASFFWIVALAVPWKLAALARASTRRWSTTWMVAVYSLVLLGLVWVLPLFPAEPKLGPVYRQITAMVPPEFPILLIAPAFVLDLLRPRLERRNRWIHALVAGATFVVVLVAVQWPFATFLMSPLARNRFFGTIFFDYSTRPTSAYLHYQFIATEATRAQFWRGMGLAIGAAALTTRIGLAWGTWMRQLKR
jgi:hypothetical protein